MGKSTIHGIFQIAMLVYQRVKHKQPHVAVVIPTLSLPLQHLGSWTEAAQMTKAWTMANIPSFQIRTRDQHMLLLDVLLYIIIYYNYWNIHNMNHIVIYYLALHHLFHLFSKLHIHIIHVKMNGFLAFISMFHTYY